MNDVSYDQQTTGQSYRQAKKVDEGNKTILLQIPDGNLNIVEKHIPGILNDSLIP
jgi:hypothetical protein